MTVCPFATWRPVQNCGPGAMSAHLGLVLHVQEGNNGLSGWFNNPESGASSTWWVSKSGALEQYVDADVTAWAQGSGNDTYCSVESEGYHTDPLTDAQIAMLGELYAWGADVYGWPMVLAEHPGQLGLGWHGMGGDAWGGHTGCPGDPRKAQRADILAAAGGSTGPAPAKRKGHNMIASTSTGNGYWTVSSDGAVGAFGDAEYHGGGFAPDIVTGEVIGIAGKDTTGYWLFASDGGVMAFGSAEFLGRPDRA